MLSKILFCYPFLQIIYPTFQICNENEYVMDTGQHSTTPPGLKGFPLTSVGLPPPHDRFTTYRQTAEAPKTSAYSPPYHMRWLEDHLEPTAPSGSFQGTDRNAAPESSSSWVAKTALKGFDRGEGNWQIIPFHAEQVPSTGIRSISLPKAFCILNHDFYMN